jgi:hypothetical protein
MNKPEADTTDRRKAGTPGRRKTDKAGSPRAGKEVLDEQVKAAGLAEGLLDTLGKMVPGLGRLVETASRIPEFQDRLASIDDEIKRKFKDQPMRNASVGISGAAGRRHMGIPPAVRRAGAGGGAASAASGKSGSTPARGKRPGPRPPKVHISPETPAELAVDVFDEGREILVLAEAPGLTRRDIQVSLEGRTLVLSVEAGQRKSIQRIDLPCDVTGRPKVSFANGIMHILVRKATKA